MIVTTSLQDSEIEDGFESPADLAEAEVPDSTSTMMQGLPL